jgi:hypothetical protein
MRREKMHKPNFKGAETGDLTSAIGKYQEEKSKMPRGVGKYALSRGIETIDWIHSSCRMPLE